MYSSICTTTSKHLLFSGLTMASMEPLTGHLVISPFWITRVLEAGKEKRTAPSPLDMVESLTEQRNLAGFGYDPDYLLPFLPEAKFAVAFDDVVQISSERFGLPHPVWKLKRTFRIGSEKHLRAVVLEVREFTNTIVREKKWDLSEAKALEFIDLLSWFLSSDPSDEMFITDIVISFTLAGRDTTLAALTWFFWLLYQNPCVEQEILKVIKDWNFSAFNGFWERKKTWVLCGDLKWTNG
ncbi:hypothetical protein PS1_038695 [Malus domestica]